MIENEGRLAGKNLLSYTSKSWPCSYDKFRDELRKYKLFEALRIVGELSANLLWGDHKNGNIIVIEGVPINDYMLSFIAQCLIESTNDYRSKIPSLQDISKICDMYYALPEPPDYKKDPLGIIIRTGYASFSETHDFFQSIARCLLIYGHVDDFAAFGAIQINQEIELLTGLSIEELIAYVLSYSQLAKKGFLFPYNVNKSSRAYKAYSYEKQNAFLNWVSCGYPEFRESTQKIIQSFPDTDYKKYQFNYLSTKPLIIPDVNPSSGNSKPYIVPSSFKLFQKIIKGLYYDLSEKFKGDGASNPFRTAFGKVFEKYVGFIIKKSLPEANVLPESQYARGNKLSSDWIVIEDTAIILIETKLSGLFLKAKSSGENAILVNDMQKTLIHGLKQLLQFEADLSDSKYDELQRIPHETKKIYRLIVTYDKVYYANSFIHDVIKDEVIKEGTNLQDKDYWHIISIDEFELLLANSKKSISDILEKKEMDKEGREMDFHDYLARNISPLISKNQYLSEIFEKEHQSIISALKD